MKNFIKTILALLVILNIANTQAQNPVLIGYADPAMKVHDGKMYMIVGKDLTVDSKKFLMPYWTVVSSTDLRDWKVEAHIEPQDTHIGQASMNCWAADLAFANNKVYVFFSNGGQETGLVVADTPQGPYKNVLQKAFLPKEMSDNAEYDPTTFEDDNGKKYLIFGRDGVLHKKPVHFSIVELNDDLLSLKGTPQPLLTDSIYGFGNSKQATDHSYFHKNGDTYYLSCAGLYRSSKKIEGPYVNLRNTGQLRGHASFSSYNGQGYHAWEFTAQPYNNRKFRQVMMTYLHYKDNGDMISDPNFIETGKYYETGVGSYVATWDKIEAEWFFRKSEGILKKEGQNGFVLKNIRNNDYVNFPSIIKMKPNTTINFDVASKATNGIIEIRLNSVKGELLGTCTIKNTGDWNAYKTSSTTLKNAGGINNLYFVFKGNDGELAHLNSFNFSK